MPSDEAQRGREAREHTPRDAHGEWTPAADRADPIAILLAQDASRVPELVPIRHGRMLASPFAFYRGAAAIMAADLASTAATGLNTQLCGDAHLSNFGGFRTPQGELVFALDDFDETLAGPWEWDVKRLAASVEIATRDQAAEPAKRSKLVCATVAEYRRAMRELAAESTLDVWYADADGNAFAQQLAGDEGVADADAVRRAVAQATNADSLSAVAKLSHVVDGRLRFVDAPPLLVAVEGRDDEAIAWLAAYRESLTDDRAALLDRYRFVDLARKVVGVGSVGMRTWVVLLEGRSVDDALVLQVKEAQASVLEPFLGPSPYANHGERVVAGHRLMAPATDVFVGWCRVAGEDGQPVDYHVRHRWHRHGETDVATLKPRRLRSFATACALALARSHARSPDAAAIAGYLGAGDAFDRALARFASVYADQNAADHAAFAAAVGEGRVAAQPVV